MAGTTEAVFHVALGHLVGMVITILVPVLHRRLIGIRVALEAVLGRGFWMQVTDELSLV
jgi:hypothetical protein